MKKDVEQSYTGYKRFSTFKTQVSIQGTDANDMIEVLGYIRTNYSAYLDVGNVLVLNKLAFYLEKDSFIFLPDFPVD